MQKLTSNPLLELYRENFVEMIKTDNTTIIGNQSKEHAVIILQELIRHAMESVYIACTRLSKEIYGNKELLNIIKEAMSRGVSFYIAVKRPIECKTCENIFTDNGVHIKKNDNMEMQDFCVADKKRFRIEINQGTKEARVCANNQELSSLMIQLFDKFCSMDYNPA